MMPPAPAPDDSFVGLLGKHYPGFVASDEFRTLEIDRSLREFEDYVIASAFLEYVEASGVDEQTLAALFEDLALKNPDLLTIALFENIEPDALSDLSKFFLPRTKSLFEDFRRDFW